MRSKWLALAVVVASAALVATGCDRAPKTAEDVLARSLKAHGGEGLTAWKTMAVRGRVEMQDGITYNAAFLLQAKAPGHVRVEQDMTADRGRIFNDLFLSDGQAWSRRNLVVNPRGNVKQMQRWLRHCYGIAYYEQHGTEASLGPDETVEWKSKPDAAGKTVVVTRPAYVVTTKVDGEAVKLFVDKDTFYLIQESWPDGRRVHRDFKVFGRVTFPTRVQDITRNRQGVETVLPYTYEAVTFDAPIQDWVFTEDRPKERG